MEYLSPSKGWFPLCVLAPVIRQTFPMPEPLTASAWQHASALAVEALKRVHQNATVLLGGHQHLSVHGDVRLPNIIGHVGEGHEVDRVIFVDFGWAGLESITRYSLYLGWT